MAESNKLTNILLGAAIIGLGYVIYQTYPNEITANADIIKKKVKGFLSKKKQSNKVASAIVVNPNADSQLSHPENCSCSDCLNNSEEIDIFMQEQPWNNLPNQLGTDVIQHFDIEATNMNQQAINNITGNQPTRA
jgi:hypothetical protein